MQQLPNCAFGDFNLDMLENSHQQRKSLSFMQRNDFIFHTKKTTHYSSMLDHFWTNLLASTVSFHVFDAYWTYHHTICLTIYLLSAWVLLAMSMFYNFIVDLSQYLSHLQVCTFDIWFDLQALKSKEILHNKKQENNKKMQISNSGKSLNHQHQFFQFVFHNCNFLCHF